MKSKALQILAYFEKNCKLPLTCPKQKLQRSYVSRLRWPDFAITALECHNAAGKIAASASFDRTSALTLTCGDFVSLVYPVPKPGNRVIPSTAG
jgi:hypothetical protein